MAHGYFGRRGFGRNGFTLVELVAVIVILGILSATASAKFVSIQSDAKAAVLKNIQGNIRSANSMLFAKALINNVNTGFSEKSMTGSDTTWSDDKHGRCAFNNCANIGDVWVYLKYAYVDRNSISYILDADISGVKTKEVKHYITGKSIKIPDRTKNQGDVNYACSSAGNAVCTGHDFCQCRSNSETIDGIAMRDTQYIIPKGYKYNQTGAKPNERCYFKYSSAEYLEYKVGKETMKKVFPPAYTLETGGC